MAKGTKGKAKRESSLRSALELFSAADLEDMFRSLDHSAGNDMADDDLDRAQEIAFDAMDAGSRSRRIALAREALAISPLCSDGYFVLGMEADSPEAALPHFQEAVEAGAKVLGEKSFQEDAGHFWGLIQTRPYMRARHMLAATLWRTGERDEAIAHYRDMLRLNPNDNQGIRYLLMDALLELGRDADAAELSRRYKGDGMAAWAWSDALIEFRRTSNSAGAQRALKRAIAANPHVPDYLTGRKALPLARPEYHGIGDEAEAVDYVDGAQGAWAASEGALAWVESHSARSAASPAKSRRQGDEENLGEDREISAEAIDRAVLALLYLNQTRSGRAWKGFDWDAMDRLHEAGLISDPASKAKSVRLTIEGLEAAELAFTKLFTRPAGKMR